MLGFPNYVLKLDEEIIYYYIKYLCRIKYNDAQCYPDPNLNRVQSQGYNKSYCLLFPACD